MRGDTRVLAFGSFWLGDFRLDSGAGARVSSSLEQLVYRRDAMTKSIDDKLKFKWQMLAMERQWLSYLDLKSSKTSSSNNSDTAGHKPATKSCGQNDCCELVISIGAGRSADGTQTGLGRSLAADGGMETTLGPASMSSSSLTSSSSVSICHLSDNTIEDATC